jgi:4-hydroxybenzoate polyprenyltransferase
VAFFLMNRKSPQEKRLIVRILDWLLYTSVFASCCAVALCMATERLILQVIPPLCSALHVFIFGSALVIYNVHHVIRKPASQELSSWLHIRHRRDVWMAVTGALLCGITAFRMNGPVLLACCVLSVCSFAYSVPLLPFRHKRRLKDFGWIKIWILAGVWTAVTAVLPMLYWQQQMAYFPFEILIRFVLMFILCLAFDIRDVHIDENAGIYTLPSKIGLRATYRLIDILLLLFVLLCLLQYLRYGSLFRFSGSILAAWLARLAIHYAKRHPSNKVYLLYVDGVMLLYALLVLLH